MARRGCVAEAPLAKQRASSALANGADFTPAHLTNPESCDRAAYAGSNNAGAQPKSYKLAFAAVSATSFAAASFRSL